jgi:hypothetical protein
MSAADAAASSTATPTFTARVPAGGSGGKDKQSRFFGEASEASGKDKQSRFFGEASEAIL